MNRLNTRKWSTPATIGTGLFVSVSGVIMFLGVHDEPLSFAHEWVGLGFAVAILFHILNHWKVFRKYFSQLPSLAIIGATLAVTAALIVTSATQAGGSFVGAMIDRVERSPLAELAPLVDMDLNEIVADFEAAGFVVDESESSIADIAKANGTQPRKLLEVLFN